VISGAKIKYLVFVIESIWNIKSNN